MSFFDTQNPGIGGLKELTSNETLIIQQLGGLTYSNGDILYYNNGSFRRLAIGSNTNVLTVTGGLPVWAAAAGGGSGITGVAVASSNGFTGTSDGNAVTPTITLTTSVTGLLKGNGTAISAATAGTDYVTASSTNTFTNKTFDTAGTGNSFSIAGVAATANTGTGSVVRATSPTLVTPALGTPTAIVLTSGTGLPISTGVTGLGTGIATWLATPSSANLIAAVTDETGSGSLVFATSPTLVTPALGVATATSINGLTITTSTGTLTVAALKTLTVNNTLTLGGTDGTTMTFPTTSATLARTDAANAFTGASTTTSWVMTSPTITTGITPTTNDGAALGTISLAFADLFMASGAKINIANNWQATHASGLVQVDTGDFQVYNAGSSPYSVVTASGSQTIANKRFNPKVETVTSSSTPTPNLANGEIYTVTALATGATIGSPTGTPVSGQKLIIRIKDNATAQTLAYNAIFRAVGVTLPTTTVISKTLYLGCIYNSDDTKWDVVAVAQEA